MTDDWVVLDIENDGEPWSNGATGLENLVLCGVLWPDGDRYQGRYEVDAGVREVLADSRVAKVEHTKHDARWLRLAGVEVNGDIHDTQVMAWVLDENQDLDLENLNKRYTGVEMDKRIKRADNEVWFRTDAGKQVPLREAPPNEMALYNLGDLLAERDLYLELRQRMDDSSWTRYWETEEAPFTPVLVDMEVAGMPVDVEASRALRLELEAARAELETQLLRDASLPPSFNLGSGDQLAAYLFSRVFELKDALPVTEEQRAQIKLSMQTPEDPVPCDIPEGFSFGKVGRKYLHGVWTVKGRGLSPTPLSPSEKRPSTSSPKLMVHHGDDPWVADLISYRKLDKVVTTYLLPFEERAVVVRKSGGGAFHPAHSVDGETEGVATTARLYGRFNQTGTKTGRLSSSGPNLQNIPAHGDTRPDAPEVTRSLGEKVRGLFKGDLVIGDFSQLEPRLMAHFSQDPLLLDVYRNDKDVYIETAKVVFEEDIEKEDPRRQMMKTYILALGYGAGPKTLRERLALNGFWFDLDEVKEHYKRLQQGYGVFFDWAEGVKAYAHRKGYVKTIGGRHRRVRANFAKKGNWKLIGYGERQAVNAVIQGSAADIVRRVMVRWPAYIEHGLLDWAIRLLAQVHDELIWEHEIPKDDRQSVLDGLEYAGEEGHGFELDVPMKFEPKLVSSWAEKSLEKPAVWDEEDAA